MKNLFDYATKELSQDAFLRWFFENYDDERLGPIVTAFLREFAKDGFADTKSEDIISIITYAQKNHIDITIEARLRQKGEEITRYVYIEDKVASCEHNQLARYNASTISTSSDRIYYKSSLIDEEERKRVYAANWKAYDIDSIAPFFRHYKDKKDISDVFSDYVAHILKIYDDFHHISPLKPTAWNKTNWRTFYYDLFDQKHYEEQGCSKSSFIYRGKYISLLFCFKMSDRDGLNQLLIEMQVRNGVINLLYRPNFKFKDKEDEWRIDNNRFKNMEGYEEYKELAQNELNSLREFVERHEKEYGFHRSNSTRAFAKTEKIEFKSLSAQEIKDRLKDVFDRIIEFGSAYKSAPL